MGPRGGRTAGGWGLRGCRIIPGKRMGGPPEAPTRYRRPFRLSSPARYRKPG
ncbi:hypothetical protein [Azospirillum doebereinerae]